MEQVDLPHRPDGRTHHGRVTQIVLLSLAVLAFSFLAYATSSAEVPRSSFVPLALEAR